MAPIRCADVDLDGILQAFPATRTTFPMKYLGLPLTVSRLRRIHFQPLEDKVANKLIPWHGKHISMDGAKLVKSVLTSVAAYHHSIQDET